MNLHIGGSGLGLSPSEGPCKSKTHAKRLRETADRLHLLQEGSERDRENCLDYRITDRLKRGVLYLTFACIIIVYFVSLCTGQLFPKSRLLGGASECPERGETSHNPKNVRGESSRIKQMDQVDYSEIEVIT